MVRSPKLIGEAVGLALGNAPYGFFRALHNRDMNGGNQNAMP
jgi:hypothetical protein